MREGWGWTILLMHTVNYGFHTDLRRSGQAACWCPPLRAIVQFGGWPPGELLSRVVHVEGSSCPLYYLTAADIYRGAQHANRSAREMKHPHHHHPILLEEGMAADSPLAKMMANPSVGAPSSCSSSSNRAPSEDPYEGYHSEPDEFLETAGGAAPESSSSTAGSDSTGDTSPPLPSPAAADREGTTPHVAVATPMERLRVLRAEGPTDEATAVALNFDRASSTVLMTTDNPTSAKCSIAAESELPVALHSRRFYRDAKPILQDTRQIRGKCDQRPLHWRAIRPIVSPRTRHGHHLIYHANRLYVIGGSYWAHGNALSSSDMCFDLANKTWEQLDPLLPSRFCAAVAVSNIKLPTTTVGNTGCAESSNTSEGELVLYAFGGMDFNCTLTSTLHRLWLPSGAVEELPQYGTTPRDQFKGNMVCDVQEEQTPSARSSGACAVGRLFYLDGYQDGRPMVPALRCYNLTSGVWTKTCSCPDLVRGQVSLRHYKTDARTGKLYLNRFDIMGGMPSRRGKQRRSRMCHSYDVKEQFFDFASALPVPGLTAHTVVELPEDAPPEVKRLRDEFGVTAVSCGGNEDMDAEEQNSLGQPVSWVYLLSLRPISFLERLQVGMERRNIPYRLLLSKQKDDILEDLF